MKTEIEATRIGGFGSSDAKDIYSCGKNQTLNKTMQKRLAVMLGKKEKQNFSTQSTKYGDFIEESIFYWIKDNPAFKDYEFISNPYYEVENLKYPFKCFNHIDIEAKKNDSVIWFEIKAVNGNLEKTMKDYLKQLVWHQWTQKSTYPDKNIKLFLVHYHTEDKHSNFDPSKISLNLFTGNSIVMTHITSGLEYLNTAIHNFEYKEETSLNVTVLPPELQKQLDEIYLFEIQKKEMKTKISSFTDKMYSLMTSKAIDNIKTVNFKMIRIAPTKTRKINLDKLAKEYPEVYESCIEETNKKGYVLLKTI